MAEASARQKEEDKSFDHELAGKYLTFNLGDERYGLKIKPINDIVEMQEYTKIPRTADYVKGVINLRGTVIPVIDLRLKFGMSEREYDRKTCIVVVNIKGVQTGLIVDSVNEVLQFSDEQIDSSRKMSSDVQVEFVAGIGKLNEKVYILLDLDRIMSEEELEEVKTAVD